MDESTSSHTTAERLQHLRIRFRLMRRHPAKYIYWIRCWHCEVLALYRNNRWTGHFEMWDEGKWVDARAQYWTVVADDGWRLTMRRAWRTLAALKRGEDAPCGHREGGPCSPSTR